MGEEEGATKTKTKEEMEGEITAAMRARVSDFKAKADSLTLEGVRRALEVDLGLKEFSLDAHKRFIKQCLQECFNSADDENVSKKSDIDASSTLKEENPGDSRDTQPSSELRNCDSTDQEKEGSHDLNKVDNHEKEDMHCSEPDTEINEDTIKDAINGRAVYFRTNSESITLAEVRRTLEQDLKLGKKALDAYKSFIAEELGKVLQPPKNEPKNGVKKKLQKVAKKIDEKSPKKGSKRAREESDSSETNGSASEDEDDKSTKSKKKETKKIKASTKSNERQKKLADNKLSSSRVKKPMDADSERSSADEGGSSSDDGQSNVEKAKKKQEKPPHAYSKQVEHLKSIIKSCGMGVPPSIYKKVKQAPESKREAYLIRELEEILEKEGLSSDPSEKEIKAVKKRKERAKELEGIDMSNIITSSRRRTTSSYIPPPKPKPEVKETDEEENEDEEDENDDDNEQESDDGSDSAANSDEGSDEGAEDESD